MDKPVCITVIADTHVHSLDELSPIVLNALSRSDFIFHLGDFTSPQLIDDLQKFGNFYGIWGNHDRLPEIRRRLNRIEVLEIAGKKLGLVHGTFYPVGRQRRLKAWFKKYHIDILLFGHSHVFTSKLLNGVLLFNPGSATSQFPAARGSFGILTIDGDINGEIVPLPRNFNLVWKIVRSIPAFIIREGTSFLESWPYLDLSFLWNNLRVMQKKIKKILYSGLINN